MVVIRHFRMLVGWKIIRYQHPNRHLSARNRKRQRLKMQQTQRHKQVRRLAVAHRTTFRLELEFRRPSVKY